jgi:hypothetical protein
LIFSALEVRAEFELFTSGVITASAKANDQGRFKIIQGVADVGSRMALLRID